MFKITQKSGRRFQKPGKLRVETLYQEMINKLRDKFLQTQFQALTIAESTSIVFSSCRPSLQVDPILWLPMTTSERSRVLRWRLGWLPGGKPKPCPYHPTTNWSRRHATICLHIHLRLFMPLTVEDPLSFLLNLLPVRTPRREIDSRSWFTRWPTICTLLHELDYLFHDELPPPVIDPGQKLLNWLSK